LSQKTDMYDTQTRLTRTHINTHHTQKHKETAYTNQATRYFEVTTVHCYTSTLWNCINY